MVVCLVLTIEVYGIIKAILKAPGGEKELMIK